MIFQPFFSVAIIGASLALAASPSKPEISPAIPRGTMETDLRNNLHPTQSTWDYWGSGWIPQGCKDLANQYKLNPSDFTIFNVHYTDCGEAWVMCRHKNAGASEIDMIDIFGRLPVHMRSYIRYGKQNLVRYALYAKTHFLDTLLQPLASTMVLPLGLGQTVTVLSRAPHQLAYCSTKYPIALTGMHCPSTSNPLVHHRSGRITMLRTLQLQQGTAEQTGWRTSQRLAWWEFTTK